MENQAVVHSQEVLPLWEQRLRRTALVIARVGLAYLFFTQLFWKMPPDFGCPSDYAFTTGSVDESGRLRLQRTSGLCDWIGVENVWADQPRPFFVANIDNQGAPEISIDLGWAAKLNNLFLENIAMPNIRWFGWFIWGGEAFIFVSLLLGFFSRLGGLTAVAMSGQLMIGLAGISNPYEWEWSYNLMVLLSLLMFAFAPGRVFGVDTWLRPRLRTAAEGDDRAGRIAHVLLWLT
jgi:uncharacterized membrane protein YphA (DoxX/SURF4 family)